MSFRPKLLFINHAAEMGGAEFSLEQIVTELPYPKKVLLFTKGPFIERLRSKGVDVSHYPGIDKLFARSIDISLGKRLAALPGAIKPFFNLRKELRDTDVIYINAKKSVIYTATANIFIRKPIIWHQRDLLLRPKDLSPTKRIAEALVIFLLQHCVTHIICISNAVKNSLASAGFPASRTSVIYNGISPEPFAYKIGRATVRKKAGLPIPPVTIGTFARLTNWKGQDILIRSIQNLPDIHLAIVGGSALGEKEYEEYLHQLVLKLGIRNRVHFLGHQDNIPELLQAVDIVAHVPTLPEPFGRIIIEAMLSERPVIASKIGGIPEIIENSKSGLLVPPGDIDALQEAICLLLKDRQYAERLAQAGKRRALTAFSFSRVSKEISRTIDEVSSASCQ